VTVIDEALAHAETLEDDARSCALLQIALAMFDASQRRLDDAVDALCRALEEATVAREQHSRAADIVRQASVHRARMRDRQ
jgi:hypothetical protein